MVDAAGEFVETGTEASKLRLKRVQFECPQIPNCLNSNLLQTSLCHFADTGNAAYGQRRQEYIHVLRLNDEEAVRLAPVGSDLGQELVRSDARGGSERQLFANLPADGNGNFRCRGQARLVLCDIEVGFVER